MCYSYKILFFMYFFGYFFQKEYFKGSSEKRAHRQKPLGGTDNPIPLLLRRACIYILIVTRLFNAKLKPYVKLLFQNNYIPLILKPTRISKMNATIIDHISTNNTLEIYIKTRILKCHISEHFPVFIISKTIRADKHCTETVKKDTRHIKHYLEH